MGLNLINNISFRPHWNILKNLYKKHWNSFRLHIGCFSVLGLILTVFSFNMQWAGPISAYTYFTMLVLFLMILAKIEPLEELRSPLPKAKKLYGLSVRIFKTGFTGGGYSLKAMCSSRVSPRARAYRSPRRASFAAASGSPGDGSGGSGSGDPDQPEPPKRRLIVPPSLLSHQRKGKQNRTPLPWLPLGCCCMFSGRGQAA